MPCHAEATKEDANKELKIGDYIIYVRDIRTIFPAVVSYESRAHWVFFIVDTGAPLTYLRKEGLLTSLDERSFWY